MLSFCVYFSFKAASSSYQRFEVVETALRVSSSSKQALGAARVIRAVTTTLVIGYHESRPYAHTAPGPYYITSQRRHEYDPHFHLREGKEAAQGHTTRDSGCWYKTQVGLKSPSVPLCCHASLLFLHLSLKFNPTSSQAMGTLPHTYPSFWSFFVSVYP